MQSQNNRLSELILIHAGVLQVSAITATDTLLHGSSSLLKTPCFTAARCKLAIPLMHRAALHRCLYAYIYIYTASAASAARCIYRAAMRQCLYAGLTLRTLLTTATLQAGDAIVKDSFLDRFYARTRSMDTDAIAADLEGNDEIEETHEAAAAEGQSDAPAPDEDVNTHFVCFT
jgi:Ubiquitin carboxyl-terminal hydrolase, family 1